MAGLKSEAQRLTPAMVAAFVGGGSRGPSPRRERRGEGKGPSPPRSSTAHQQHAKGRRKDATPESLKAAVPSPPGPEERQEAAEPGQEAARKVPEDHVPIAADAEAAAATSLGPQEEPQEDLSCSVVVEPINFEELEVEALKAEIAALRDEGGDLQSSNAKLKAEIAALREEGSYLQTRNAKFEASAPVRSAPVHHLVPLRLHPYLTSTCTNTLHTPGLLQELVRDQDALAEQQQEESKQLKEELGAAKEQLLRAPLSTTTAEAVAQYVSAPGEEAAAASGEATEQELKSLRLQLEEAAEAGARGQAELSVARCGP